MKQKPECFPLSLLLPSRYTTSEIIGGDASQKLELKGFRKFWLEEFNLEF
jgi:hypothetical protein